MLVLFKATALLIVGTFVIGMGIAFVTNELGNIFLKLAAQKEKKKTKKAL